MLRDGTISRLEKAFRVLQLVIVFNFQQINHLNAFVVLLGLFDLVLFLLDLVEGISKS